MTGRAGLAILGEGEAGLPVAEVCRKHGISTPTYSVWKSKFVGIFVNELKRTKDLQAENARLKRMYAELALENAVIKDVQARWTKKKHGKSYLGYKLLTSVDRRHKLILGIHISTASEHDPLHFEGVLDAANTSHDVWADKGYVDGEREQRLTAQGWRIHIQRKGQAAKTLSDCQERRNRRIDKTRARVEHIYASLEQLGGKALRSISLDRATLDLNWKAAAYNLRPLCSLMDAGPVAF